MVITLLRSEISIHSLVKRETAHRNCNCIRYFISIHSLVKRETFHLSISANRQTISIHSLVKRETLDFGDYSFEVGDFNPLPRKEGDQYKAADRIQECISIHSLVKRETEHGHHYKLFCSKFQSTPS